MPTQLELPLALNLNLNLDAPRLSELQRFQMRNTRRKDALTSVDAAADAHRHVVKHQAMALKAHFEHAGSGLTDFELAEIVKVSQPSIGKRRLDLQRKGFIEFTGQKRAAPSGSMAMVFRITATGKQEYLEANLKKR